jgi:hypothetical protein
VTEKLTKRPLCQNDPRRTERNIEDGHEEV